MTLWSSLVLAALVWGQPVQPANPIYGPVPRAQCFPVEGLSTGDRAKAEEWLLAALDGEALYTILDTIKPVSSGIHNLSFSSKDPDLTAIEQARRVADALRCGENLTTMVQIFAIESQIERFAELMMINRAEFDAKLAAERGFFARFGLSPGIVPVQAMAVIEPRLRAALRLPELRRRLLRRGHAARRGYRPGQGPRVLLRPGLQGAEGALRLCSPDWCE
jgi:hypothetical protein